MKVLLIGLLATLVGLGYGQTTEPWCPPETTTLKPTPCDAGWKRFPRSKGAWCIRVFKGTMTQANAEAKCKAQGATLSGMETSAEIRHMTTSALSLFGTGSIWVGARRTSACAKSYLTATCTKTNSFRWTDTTTGTAGWLWNTKQPDNVYQLTQQCAVLLAAEGGTVVDQHTTWYNNRLDDIGCDNYGAGGARKVKGYACGKKARS